MVDARVLLDALLGAAARGAGGKGTGSAGGVGGLAGSALGGAGGVGGLVKGALVAAAAQAAEQAVGRYLGGAKGGPVPAGKAGGARPAAQPPAAPASTAGAMVGAAVDFVRQNPGLVTSVGTLLIGAKGGRAVLVGAARLGGLALIGGLAHSAYQSYAADKPARLTALDPVAPPPTSPYGETGRDDEDAATALLLLRAMIAAALADGVIDDEERERILGGAREAGLGLEHASALARELQAPLSVDELAEGVTSTEMAAQVYTAARLTIDPDRPEERDFLDRLAARLGLGGGLVAHLDAAAASVPHGPAH